MSDASVRLMPKMTTAMCAALSSRWLASRLVVNGRNETKSSRTRLRPIITWSVALVNRRQVAVRHPDAADEREAHQVPEVAGPLGAELVEQAHRVGGHVQLQHEQRDGDREHAVGERLQTGPGEEPDHVAGVLGRVHGKDLLSRQGYESVDLKTVWYHKCQAVPPRREGRLWVGDGNGREDGVSLDAVEQKAALVGSLEAPEPAGLRRLLAAWRSLPDGRARTSCPRCGAAPAGASP